MCKCCIYISACLPFVRSLMHVCSLKSMITVVIVTASHGFSNIKSQISLKSTENSQIPSSVVLSPKLFSGSPCLCLIYLVAIYLSP